MKVGVTGTREGMTAAQEATFLDWVGKNAGDLTEFHHGDCVGVDNETADIIADLWDDTTDSAKRNCRIFCHPPVQESLRAFNKRYHEIYEAKTHFARNRAIVDAVDLLIVIPKQTERQERGGTWYTHDYAKKKNVPLLIIWPDGRMERRKSLPPII